MFGPWGDARFAHIYLDQPVLSAKKHFPVFSFESPTPNSFFVARRSLNQNKKE